MVQGMLFKRYFLSRALVALLFSRAKSYVLFLVAGIMRNDSVKLFRIWTSGSGGNVIYLYFLSRALAVLVFGGVVPFVQFW